MYVYVCMYPIRFFRWAPNPEKRHPKGSWSPQARKWPVLLATHILESRFFEGHHVCIRVWRLHLVVSWFRIVTLCSLATSSFTRMTAKMLMYPAISEKILIPLCLSLGPMIAAENVSMYVCMPWCRHFWAQQLRSLETVDEVWEQVNGTRFDASFPVPFA